MSGPTFEEMEAKRQEMIASFKDIAAAMTRCVSIIEDYTRLSPASIPSLNSFTNALPTLSHAELQKAMSSIDATGATVSTPVPEKKKRNKAEKKPKDPNAPKRPPSAYILYQNHVRDALRKERPEMAYKEVLQLIAEKWKNLPQSEKVVFESKYSNAQSEYKSADDAYKAGGPTPKPAVQAADVSSSDDSSDDSDDSSDESTNGLAPFTMKAADPPTLYDTDVITKEHKDKKRKNKEMMAEAAAAAPTPVAGEEKKKKKSKKNKE